MELRRILLASVALLAAMAPRVASAEPITIPEGVDDPLPGLGTGLCAASAISTNPQGDFGLNAPDNFSGAVNSFIEAHVADRVEATIRTRLDLSNNNASNETLSYGDFIDAALDQGCKTGGCDFFVNDPSTRFGSRMRGYLNVTPDFVNQPIHLGLYADDAVSVTIYDKTATPHVAAFRPPEFGAATWRLTDQVTFQKAGLYPIEIAYIQLTEHAALEMSYFVGDFADFEREANIAPIVHLNEVGFQLFPETMFFQTRSGTPAYPNLGECKQCKREFVNQTGNSGCGGGYYCNDAAVCAPCDTDELCGPSCVKCAFDTPFCVNINGNVQCGACKTDEDCTGGFVCNPDTKTCDECNSASDCPKGEACVEHKCEPCSTSAECAGASCNCCPDGANGQQMKCAPLEPNGNPSCVECTTDADCGGGICNLSVGRCQGTLPENNSPTCCGDGCINCTALETIVVNGTSQPRYPFCLPGPVGTACAECRHDMDCGEGAFCLSGTCTPCTRDKRCGMRCDSCGGDTPFCYGQNAAVAACVRCADDSQCGDGSTCDTATHTCTLNTGCMVTCGAETPHCDGNTCVACYADSHCPCGGTCNLSTNTCTPSCKTNVDCLGSDHCRWNEAETAKECALGPMPDGVDCGGTLATICSARPGRHGGGAPGAALLVLSVLGLLGRRRLRSTLRGEP
ncbi:outer membrane exchange protein TraA family protein [Polyangium sp. y55x31]|uniref:outer membrane exchange protein TraA family protein n=1 Tax=Polyangium sp. y55x31 TaxID=3042688 RepID=UPI0024822430|nr:outer membrane exchange protein TraA family protein [Polyangium sp. y55x31]MDI1475086.1 outer membrane exchange protein TraA family protein [Polyangium sp. y55x31]